MLTWNWDHKVVFELLEMKHVLFAIKIRDHTVNTG